MRNLIPKNLDLGHGQNGLAFVKNQVDFFCSLRKLMQVFIISILVRPTNGYVTDVCRGVFQLVAGNYFIDDFLKSSNAIGNFEKKTSERI